MRHMFVSWSQDVKNVVGIRRGTWLSSYSELYFTFTLSALCHGLITYAMPYGPDHTFYLRFWMWFNFMFFQAFAIHLEDIVIWCYKRVIGEPAGKNQTQEGAGLSWQMVLGYFWVASCWYFVLGWCLNALLQLGIAQLNPLPFSVLQPILETVEKNLLSK